jgi:hypothetical protein
MKQYVNMRRKSTTYVLILLLLPLWSLFGQSRLQVSATSTASQSAAAYIFNFTLDRELGKADRIGVVFPQGFDLSQIAMADSRAMTGGLLVTVRKDTVWATRTGRGAVLPAGSKVDLVVAVAVKTSSANASEFVILVADKQNNVRQSKQQTRIEAYKKSTSNNL